MGKPRSDELPILPEPQESSEDESSESQMWKVMRTEVEELGSWDENTKISADGKNIPYLSLHDQKMSGKTFLYFVFCRILG